MTSVAMFGPWLALIARQNGDLQAWRVSCIDPRRPTIERLWPNTEKDKVQPHGVGRIVECFPEECRFITSSISTGMVEWFANLEDGVLSITATDQLSRDAHFLWRAQGQGDLLPVTACTYLRGSSCVAMVVQGEIHVVAVCLADQQKEVLQDLQPAAASERDTELRSPVLSLSSPLSYTDDASAASADVAQDRPLSMVMEGREAEQAEGDLAEMEGRLRQAVAARVDTIHILRTLDVIPTPYTVRFSSEKGVGGDAEFQPSALLSEQEVSPRAVGEGEHSHLTQT